jgi:sulfite exporter TauE/SafE
MTDVGAFAIAGLGLGLLHSFEPDHLAAMSTLVGKTSKSSRSTAVDAVKGAVWGLGHTLALGTLGVLLAVAGMQTSGWAERVLEAAVGVLLVCLGMLRLRDAGRGLHQHPHRHGDIEHVHFHLHPPRTSHDGLAAHLRHSHAPLWIGILHGMAGSGAVLVLAPVLFAEDPLTYLGYILAFGLGSILSMSAFCAGLGGLANSLRSRAAAAGRWFAATAGSLGVAVGMIWLARAFI